MSVAYSRGTGRVGDRRLGQEMWKVTGVRGEALHNLTRAPGLGRRLAGE